MKEALGMIVLMAVTLLVIAGLLIGVGWVSRAINLEGTRIFGPAEAEAERQIVQETKAFIDSQNSASLDDIGAYKALRVEVAKSVTDEVAAAYEGQQEALVANICARVARMNADTVAPAVREFLSMRGGCN